jgi:hypothetical protein
MRQEFVDKFEAMIEQSFRERLLQKMEDDDDNNSVDSEENIEFDTRVFIDCLDDCLDLCTHYISLFENKKFWNDIASNHRQTIWKQSKARTNTI